MSKILSRLRLIRFFKCIRAEEEEEEDADNNNKLDTFSDLDNKPQEVAKPEGGPENRSGLSQRQVFSLKQSWKAVMRVEEEFSLDMFIRLFKTNSHLQTMFQGFKDIQSDDELRSNEALEYHATLVMTTLDDAITHIDDYDFVRKLLHKTGGSHIKFSGFKAMNFMATKEPFLEAVRVTLGDRYTENMQNIYTIAITFILETLMEGINDAQAKEGTASSPAESTDGGH